jgi:hypothetical protein
MAQSRGRLEAARFAAPCEISRTTISKFPQCAGGHLRRTCDSSVQHSSADRDCICAKAYGFDTGFVAYKRGWQDFRREDLAVL